MGRGKKNWFVLSVQYLVRGILWGAFVFVLVGIIMNEAGGEGTIERIYRDFTRQALGAMLVGIACASTSIVYRIERLPFALAVAIHFIVGLGFYFWVSVRMEWMPTASAGAGIVFCLIGILFFLGIWSFFYFSSRAEARKMNRRLQELEKGEENL